MTIRALLQDTISPNYELENHGEVGFSLKYRGELIARTHLDDGHFLVEVNAVGDQEAVHLVCRACQASDTSYHYNFRF